jgi:hypothetical protein
MERNSILGSQDYRWPNPGRWAWSVDDPRDIPLLRAPYVDVIRVCEGLGVPHPGELPYRLLNAHPTLPWLVEGSSARMYGMPDVPARDGNRERPVHVTPPSDGGSVDSTLQGLPPALMTVFADAGVARHAAKVAAAVADEHHLYPAVGEGGLPFPLMVGFMDMAGVPTVDPPVPDGLSHLWIVTGHAAALIGWSRDAGWQICDVLDRRQRD